MHQVEMKPVVLLQGTATKVCVLKCPVILDVGKKCVVHALSVT